MACCTPPWSEDLPPGDMCTQCLSRAHKECMRSSCTTYGRKDGIVLGQCRRCVALLPMITTDQAAISCSVCLVVYTVQGRVHPCTFCAGSHPPRLCGGKSCNTCSLVISDGRMRAEEANDRVSFLCAVRNNLCQQDLLQPAYGQVREAIVAVVGVRH
jgi:hypothetical protein